MAEKEEDQSDSITGEEQPASELAVPDFSTVDHVTYISEDDMRVCVQVEAAHEGELSTDLSMFVDYVGYDSPYVAIFFNDEEEASIEGVLEGPLALGREPYLFAVDENDELIVDQHLSAPASLIDVWPRLGI